MDLDSAAYFSGYAKVRISCLPVYALLFNAISHFFFTGFLFPSLLLIFCAWDTFH